MNTTNNIKKNLMQQLSAIFNNKDNSSKKCIFNVLLAIVIIGSGTITLSSFYNFNYLPNVTRSTYWNNFWTTIGIQFLIAGCAVMFGAFLGFVFGIPKYIITNGGEKKTGAIAFSDNLVQVSDWLTKIIVGVGLTQLTKIPHYLGSVGNYITIHSHLSLSTSSVIAIIIYFTICGFAGGYLWTTIYYPPIMNEVYKAVTESKLDEILKESEDHKEAMRIVNEQLAKGVGQSDVPTNQLQEAISKLNAKAKDAIFQMVSRISYENADTNKRIIKRTIPIFQALILVGNENQMFEYYAELGYAYMSLRNYQDAYKALLEAYNKRPIGTLNYEHIEHNLSESLISINSNSDLTYSINEELKNRILGYLKVAIKNPRLEEHMLEDGEDNLVIRNWLQSINVTLESLKN